MIIYLILQEMEQWAKKERERKAAKKLFAMLPTDIRKEFFELLK